MLTAARLEKTVVRVEGAFDGAGEIVRARAIP